MGTSAKWCNSNQRKVQGPVVMLVLRRWGGGEARNYTLGSWESDRSAGNQVTHILVFSIFSSDSSVS